MSRRRRHSPSDSNGHGPRTSALMKDRGMCEHFQEGQRTREMYNCGPLKGNGQVLSAHDARLSSRLTLAKSMSTKLTPLHCRIWSPGRSPTSLARPTSLVDCTKTPGQPGGPLQILQEGTSQIITPNHRRRCELCYRSNKTRLHTLSFTRFTRKSC